ncbi:uncharacterized protein LOC124150191 [Haliotis rufescens]|uniref:uncharacterized protein LOC124150191 n=1 Tax=Haliotis rufescens TaxID=6454 RepID=UPI00201F37FD|nr:uncharacterized protein LOC124150191 [Haliotis rufescens]
MKLKLLLMGTTLQVLDKGVARSTPACQPQIWKMTLCPSRQKSAHLREPQRHHYVIYLLSHPEHIRDTQQEMVLIMATDIPVLLPMEIAGVQLSILVHNKEKHINQPHNKKVPVLDPHQQHQFKKKLGKGT